mgnify:CR=1 FL=1
MVTDGGGLNRFYRTTETFTAHREQDGLLNGSVVGISADDASSGGEDGNLWISTFRGISRFNPETETFKNYTPKDGLQSYEFNSTVAFKSRDRRLRAGYTFSGAAT